MKKPLFFSKTLENKHSNSKEHFITLISDFHNLSELGPV